MPITINPIRKEMVKQDLKNGIDAKTAMLNAGYSPNTAHNSTNMTVVKQCQSEIIQEFKESDITPALILGRLNKDYQTALDKGDLAVATKINELLGKYRALWTDKSVIDSHITTQEDKDILERHRSRLGLS